MAVVGAKHSGPTGDQAWTMGLLQQGITDMGLRTNRLGLHGTWEKLQS